MAVDVRLGVAGDISAMLWNGVSRIPAVERVQVHEPLELVVAGRGASAPFRGRRAEAVLGAAAEPLHVPRQAVPSIASSTPAVKRSASGIMRAKSSSGST